MEITAIIEIVGLVVIPVLMGLLGYFIRTIDNKIEEHKENCGKDMVELKDEMKIAVRRDDHIREIDRIDKDINNLRVDVNKGFDILRIQMQEDKKEIRAQMQEDKKEVITAIANAIANSK